MNSGLPVNDARGVQMPDAAQQLVEQIGKSFVVQLEVDHLTEVGFHQLHDHVDVLEVFERLLRGEHVDQFDNVFVVDERHQAQFAIRTFGVGHILKRTLTIFIISPMSTLVGS